MSSQVTLQAIGLNYNLNRLNLPSGSMLVANDVIIGRDNIVQSRRGFKEYSEALGISTDIPKQLMVYKSRLLVHYCNILSFDTQVINSDGRSQFSDFSGTFSETSFGLKIKSIEQNKNLYFTTSTGIKKISAKTASDFTTASGYIKDAGAIKALDFSVTLQTSQGLLSGFLPSDSAVAYRELWGYKDRNDNLLLGAPSDRLTVYNYLSDLITLDLNAFCIILDTINQSGSMITDGNYFTNYNTTVNSSADTFKANLLSLATKLDQDILLGALSATPLIIQDVAVAANVCTITFSSGDPTLYTSIGDILELKSFTGTNSAVVNGNRLLTNVTSTTIEFSLVTTTFTAEVPASGQIYSYNYRNITVTGDDTFAEPLDTIVISTPATSEQLRIIQNTLFRISERLKIEKTGVLSTLLNTTYVTPYSVTESANTKLVITIPPSIDSDYFLQVYRTRIFTAEGVQTLGGSAGIPIEPDDEMRLVYEGFPTSTDISNGFITFIDESPADLVANNTNLYTNPSTGEGILQANEPPPFAKDISRFKNYTFYSNTRTKYRVPIFQLLGLSNVSNGDTITIATPSVSQTYTLTSGVQEVSTFVCTTVALGDAGEYFIYYSANDATKYYFWLRVNGTGTAPVVTDGVTIPIDVLTTFTATQVATRVSGVISSQIFDFISTSATTTVTVTNVEAGSSTNASAGTSPFTTFTVVTQGDGENAALRRVLLSNNISAAQAIDETARSLARVINQQSTSPIAAYYVSGENTPPGQITLESRTLDDVAFYIMTNTIGFGTSFSPDVSPVNTNITGISIAASTVVTTGANHGLVNGNQVMISGSNSTPSIDGVRTVTVLSPTTFSVPVTVTVAGTAASWSNIVDIEISTNEEKPNRVYYSKLGQPEAVPILNYLDFGAEDKENLRVFPLRDTLYVFKEDGLYRISGESAPFSQGLFDSSCVLLAPDSIDVVNNVIYGWTVKGISAITETGVDEISNPIREEIIKLSSSKYPNFKTLTWGIGYDSDNSYTVYTNTAVDDEFPTVAFRYSTLTNTWTNIVRSTGCGIIFTDDKKYTGTTDESVIEQERKNFDRTDYADREFEINLAGNSITNNGLTLKLNSLDNIEVGDVLTQEQQLTVFTFNSTLLKLDIDPSVGIVPITGSTSVGTTVTCTTGVNHTLVNGNRVFITNSDSVPSIDGTFTVGNVTSNTFDITVPLALQSQTTTGSVRYSYELNLSAVKGDNLREKIVQLATRLDLDPGTNFSNYASRIASKAGIILSNAVGSPTVVTANSVTELVDGRVVTISGTQSPQSAPSINGTFVISTPGVYGSSTTFSINQTTITAGGTGLSFSTAPNIDGFDDIKACYNDVISRLNADTGVTYNNYSPISDTTLFETVITALDKVNKRITINLPLELVVGPLTVFKSIPCQLLYAPELFGNSLNYKQVYEATMMFENRAFTGFTMGFSSDLKPEFKYQEFKGQGNGIFGSYSNPGFGFGFFGGSSNSAPFRTIVPRDCQRCRYINITFSHNTAREIWLLYGVTLTANVLESTRAYR